MIKIKLDFPILIACGMMMIISLAHGQKTDSKAIESMIRVFKSDPKGPYKDIRWFCKDGSTRPPKERCPEPGMQRARYRDEVKKLAETDHIFLGQILATTEYTEFWDAANNHSRLKQYMLERYLFRSDNGWILRRAQYYRGAIQAEDEEQWGLNFFNWLLTDENVINKNFFLVRQAAMDIPHQGDDNRTQMVRSLSKELADSLPGFQDIRIKIHGKPDASDIQSVNKFRDANKSKLSSDQLNKMNDLISHMEIIYRPVDLNTLNKYLGQLPKGSGIADSVRNLIKDYNSYKSKTEKAKHLAQTLFQIRNAMLTGMKSTGRLALLDISINLENILFREAGTWENKTPGDLMQKAYLLGMASTGCGYMELWEWEELQKQFYMIDQKELSLPELNDLFEASRRSVEWSTGMMRAGFKDAIDLFSAFEPKVPGFIDDRVRSSILLPLGECVSNIGSFLSSEIKLSNTVMGIPGQSHIRGINPGYALGELVVLNEITDKTEISGDKIYVFDHPPADLKPVAGIATVSEGNLVSHVQLLARNLGIPNAVISEENLEALKPFSGQKVFYAVSKKGTVIMKPSVEMTAEEKKLFEVKKRQESKIVVPTEKINLNQTNTLNLRALQANQSGVICGPKAANLGQLKMLFPDNVVEGIVIPFGIFRQHMDQIIPGKNISYWAFLNNIFKTAETMRAQGQSDAEIDVFTLGQLDVLREAIKNMPLKMEFISDLENQFNKIFGQKLGNIPVFLRSDTNMEDLKDFTGAGLNLTLFNVLERDKVLSGIKEVWASPYAERSYKWRQKILLNPENVYPSILIIPGVNVNCSGVLITTGIQSGNENDLTIAFSRGVGGAVEGQAAETYLLKTGGGYLLQSPAREFSYTVLPATGGTEKKYATFEKPVLSHSNLEQIRNFTEKIRQQMTKKEDLGPGPYDIELGLKDNKIWLFQIRPFVENKNAKGSEYLASIAPEIPQNKKIEVNKPLP